MFGDLQSEPRAEVRSLCEEAAPAVVAGGGEGVAGGGLSGSGKGAMGVAGRVVSGGGRGREQSASASPTAWSYTSCPGGGALTGSRGGKGPGGIGSGGKP